MSGDRAPLPERDGAALAGKGEFIRPVRMDNVTRCEGQQIGDRAPFRREEVPGAVPCTLPVWAYPYVQGWSGKVLQISDVRCQGDEVHGKTALQQGHDQRADRLSSVPPPMPLMAAARWLSAPLRWEERPPVLPVPR